MAKYIKTEEGYKDLEESVSKIVDPVKAELSNKISNKMNTSNPTGAGYFSMNRKTGTIIGQYSHAEGYDTTANASYSHAEGYDTIARGNSSHAEGCGTIASGNSSHAEGDYTTASGNFSHAEGSGTKASEYSSHAEGSGTKASGSYSHAEGDGTTASSDYQHVQGKYNIADTSGTYAHIVGNGTPGAARSNAHTLDWNGNAWYQGDVYVGGTNQTTGSKKLATEEYVNEAIPDLSGFATKEEISEVNGVNAELTGRVATIEGDYLKKADKTELQNNIDTVATNLSNEVKRAQDAETALDGRLDTVETFFEAANIGGEAVIDTLKEIQDYIESDKTGAANMLQSIQNNATAIVNEKTRAEAAEEANANNITAINGKIGTVPADTNVVSMISAVQTTVDSLNTELGNKVDKVSGKGLSTNDYTTEEKNKLNSINVAADINAHDTSATAHNDIRQIIAALGYEDVGIYVSESEPPQSVDGDLWFDLSSEPVPNGDEVIY